MTFVELSGISKQFISSAQTIVALDDVSLSVAKGEFMSVSGPSGCGKSTLMSIIGLLDAPSSGRVSFLGADIVGATPAALTALRRRHLGYLFQDGGLIDRMTALENVQLPLVYQGLAANARRERAYEALCAFGLEEKASIAIEKLSGGERQRCGLARAVASKPLLLVCDEPTASLDEHNSDAVIAALSAMAADGSAVVCSSHDPAVIAASSRHMVMARGRILSNDAVLH